MVPVAALVGIIGRLPASEPFMQQLERFCSQERETKMASPAHVLSLAHLLFRVALFSAHHCLPSIQPALSVRETVKETC